jgi:hypothetical protein
VSEPRRVEPYVWAWEEDGISRQVNVHYTRIGTTVIYAPRHSGDELPWFDADYEFESDRGRWEDGDIVTLGSPDGPGYGLIDPDDDIDAPEDFSGVIEDVVPEQEGTRPVADTLSGTQAGTQYEYRVQRGSKGYGTVATPDEARDLIRRVHDDTAWRVGGHTLASGRCPCPVTEQQLAEIGREAVWACGNWADSLWSVDRIEKPAAAAETDAPAVSEAPSDTEGATRKEELPSMAITKIGDVVNHSALLTALNSIRAEVESRQEDVDNLAAWSGEMAERMNGIAEELKALKVDNYTVGNMNMLGDLITGQKTAADAYKNATDISVNQAESAARTAHRHHGRIQDAVDDSDAPMAKNTFYNAE